MNWAHFRDPHCYLCFCFDGDVVAISFITQEVGARMHLFIAKKILHLYILHAFPTSKYNRDLQYTTLPYCFYLKTTTLKTIVSLNN